MFWRYTFAGPSEQSADKTDRLTTYVEPSAPIKAQEPQRADTERQLVDTDVDMDYYSEHTSADTTEKESVLFLVVIDLLVGVLIASHEVFDLVFVSY